MTVVYWFLGVMLFAALVVLVIGIYEFFVEDRQDQKNHALYLRHLDKINHGK